jgi:hypothetical protein
LLENRRKWTIPPPAETPRALEHSLIGARGAIPECDPECVKRGFGYLVHSGNALRPLDASHRGPTGGVGFAVLGVPEIR